MKGLRDEARGTSTTDMNGDDRRPRRFTLAELWAAPSRCARQASATSSTRRAQLLRTRTDAGTVDWRKSQVESASAYFIGPRRKLVLLVQARRPHWLNSASAGLFVSLCLLLQRFVVSSTKFHPRRPAFMFLLMPIVRILQLARLRLSEAVRGRLFPCRATRTQSGPLKYFQCQL